MLSTNYVKQAFESHFNTTINIQNNKETLVSRFGGKDVIQFDTELKYMSRTSECNFRDMVGRFSGMPYIKVKDAPRFKCFDIYNTDIEAFTYGSENKKLTRVLSEVLEPLETLQDMAQFAIHSHELRHGVTQYDIDWYNNKYLENIVYSMKGIGSIPRNFIDDPLSMTPAQFIAWLAEQHKKAINGTSKTYYIDFRPLASLIAGNGLDFGSCYGLPCFPNREADCYNNSPSAYAMSDRTAILYSLTDDEKSLTGRAWIYFTPDNSLYFGRLYGDDMNKDVCIEAAKQLGFDPADITYEPCSVSSICTGGVYLSDQLALGFGPCVMDYNQRIELNTTCLVCGEQGIGDSSDCMCSKCSGNGCFCEHCGDSIDEDDAIYIEGYGTVCNGCARQCDDCGDWRLRDNVTDIGGSFRYHHVCDSCMDNYSYCEDCEEYTHIDNYYYIESIDMGVCDYCFHANYARCNECKEVFPTDDLSTCSDCGSYVCSDCVTVCNHCEDDFCPSCMGSDGEYCLACQDEIEAKEETVETDTTI